MNFWKNIVYICDGTQSTFETTRQYRVTFLKLVGLSTQAYFYQSESIINHIIWQISDSVHLMSFLFPYKKECVLFCCCSMLSALLNFRVLCLRLEQTEKINEGLGCIG